MPKLGTKYVTRSAMYDIHNTLVASLLPGEDVKNVYYVEVHPSYAVVHRYVPDGNGSIQLMRDADGDFVYDGDGQPMVVTRRELVAIKEDDNA